MAQFILLEWNKVALESASFSNTVVTCGHVLILLHSEHPKLYGVLVVLSAVGLNIFHLEAMMSPSYAFIT